MPCSHSAHTLTDTHAFHSSRVCADVCLKALLSSVADLRQGSMHIHPITLVRSRGVGCCCFAWIFMLELFILVRLKVNDAGTRAVAVTTDVVFTVIVLFLGAAAVGCRVVSRFLRSRALHSHCALGGVRPLISSIFACAAALSPLCRDTAGTTRRSQTLELVDSLADKGMLESSLWRQSVICFPFDTFVDEINKVGVAAAH